MRNSIKVFNHEIKLSIVDGEEWAVVHIGGLEWTIIRSSDGINDGVFISWDDGNSGDTIEFKPSDPKSSFEVIAVEAFGKIVAKMAKDWESWREFYETN